MHPLPKVLAQLSGAKVFSKLNANSGFWQISLSPSSRHLTTLHNTDFQFNKLLFVISSALKLFQKGMQKMLCGPDGVVCLIDNALIYASDEQQHNARLKAVLQRIASAGIKVLGHILNENDVLADSKKT